MFSKLSIFKQFWQFIVERKKWWLIPMVIFVVILGIFLVFAQNSVFAPFIYAIF